MMDEHTYQNECLFYKHEISYNLPCDTYSRHTHSQYELIRFVKGDASIVIENRRYKLKRDDLVIIRPLCYHFIQIDSPADYERYVLSFHTEKHGISSADLLPTLGDVISLSGNRAALDIFDRCDLYRARCDDATFERILPHLLSELFYNVSLFRSAPQEEHSSLSPLLSKAIGYIGEHLYTVKDIDEIAAHLSVSKSYLFRLFKTELHQTPRRYITDKRLLLSQKMIVSGEKPTRVCEKIGFDDYATFYRNYTAYFGHSPSEERS